MGLELTRPWRSYPILSVDFESTGTDPLTCEPVEVAVVRYEAGAIVGRFSSLLRTKEPIPEAATKVHGITNEMVADAPSLEEVSHELIKFADGTVPLAFNAPFDRTIMHRYLSGEGVPLFDPAQPWLCSFAMAWHKDRYEPGQGRLKLEACCKRRGINIVGAHRAMADALASGALFFALTATTARDLTMLDLLRSVGKLTEEREADYAKFRKQIRAEERVIWRGYAQAALGGLFAGRCDSDPGDADHEQRVAAHLKGITQYADAMVALEREKWI
jgi:DNA polymerase III epsilon subunit-like protein